MVSQTSFNGHNDNRRLGRVFPSYISTVGHQDRRFHTAGHESRTIITTEHQTENVDAPARKRIAVACGRCRQRKIRCSGDLGQNMPCSNCKNAGVSQCLFLRVSSREAPIKGDTSSSGSGGEFDYNSAAARALAHRSSISSTAPYIGTHDLSNDIYRSGDFYYGSKAYYTNVQGWGNNYEGDYSSYNVPSNCGNGPYLVSCPWTGRSKPSNLGAVNVHAQENDFTQPSQTLPNHPDISSESEVALSAFDSALPDTEAEQVGRLHGMAVGRALQTVRGAGYGDHVLSCFKSPGGSSGLMAVPSSVSDSCETLAAYNNGGIDSSASSRHANVSAYAANSSLSHGHGNHEAAFPDPETYDIGPTGESIFTEQERGVGTQGPAVSLSSYTYNPTGRPVQSYHRPGKLNSTDHVHNQTYIPTDSPAPKSQTGAHCAPASLTEVGGVDVGRHETGRRG